MDNFYYGNDVDEKFERIILECSAFIEGKLVHYQIDEFNDLLISLHEYGLIEKLNDSQLEWLDVVDEYHYSPYYFAFLSNEELKIDEEKEFKIGFGFDNKHIFVDFLLYMDNDVDKEEKIILRARLVENYDLDELYIISVEKLAEYEKKKEEEEKGSLSPDPYSTIGIHDVIVRTSNFSCYVRGHEVKTLDSVICIDNGLCIQEKKVPAWYCCDCRKYFISEFDYQRLKRLGRICCRIQEEVKNVPVTKGPWNRWNSESLLKEYGYSVAKQRGLKKKERRRILAFLVENSIMDVEEIEQSIMFNIKYHRRFKQAIQKWESDLEFVRKYKTGENKILVREIYRIRYEYN